MIGGVRIKVCGITHAADAAMALRAGADYLGVNCWDGSPRFVPAERRAELLREIPAGSRVAVTVNASPQEAEGLIKEGFALIQVHYDPTSEACDPATLSRRVGKGRLWLAPRLTDGSPWPEGLHELASGFVHDAHAKGAFGGTGRRSDWARFTTLCRSHPGKLWILAGGLSPENVLEAMRETHAPCLDLNSGVELLPGLKSAVKMHEVRQALHNYRQS